MNTSIVSLQRARDHRKQMWFNPNNCRQVGTLRRKDGIIQAIYDTGERLPGGIPVLAVRKDGRGNK